MAKRKNDDQQTASLFEGKERPVPQMPQGYYSGDKPNPNLRSFVEAHLREHAYHPETDDYDVPAFDRPIETTKATPIFDMHVYWSKKPHDAIRQYIRHYTQSGDLVLDPFCGSGSTALAALVEGRKTIAIDRSPGATFITKNYCTPVFLDKLRNAFEKVKSDVQPILDWLYETRCDRCGGKATTNSTVYSQVFQCRRCLTKVALFDCIELTTRSKSGKPKKISACPHCYARGLTEEISTRTATFGVMPVLVNYTCQGRCKPARAERRHNDSEPKKREFFKCYDRGKIDEIASKEIPYWYPTHRMMHAPEDQVCWGAKWRAGTSNFRTVDELFTRRNLWASAALLDACLRSCLPEEMKFLFCSNVLNATTMQQYREAGGGFAKGTYYVPQIFIEREQLGCVRRKLSDLLSGQREIQRSLRSTALLVSTESATDLSAIPSSSVDYIFTDPPYAGKVQYGELNFVWEAWLQLDTRWHDEEIIVNEVRGKDEADWTRMMRRAMAECYRVLKPGRWLSLCYHDTSEGTWELIQDIMAEVGFLVDKSDSALYIDTAQKTYNQLTADKVNKRDLVINFRKPKPGQLALNLILSGDEDEATFREKARAVIRDYLTAHSGATKDRVYDELVSHMVRTGRMEAHNFDELLAQVAEPSYPEGADDRSRDGARWYLKETEAEAADIAETAKEDAAAERLRDFMRRYLEERPGEEGVHHSDLWEHFVYTVPPKDKPRRPLGDWLPDYFFKTPGGTYRLPESEEEERLKEEGRARGLGRRIKRYLSYLQQGVAVPERERPNAATLAEWLGHCRRSGLYEQGRLLYETSAGLLDGLPEEQMEEAEEDYSVCVRELRRASAVAARPRRGKQAAMDL
jgi:DNA modification methylase